MMKSTVEFMIKLEDIPMVWSNILITPRKEITKINVVIRVFRLNDSFAILRHFFPTRKKAKTNKAKPIGANIFIRREKAG